jgi:hypothetical protein
MKCRIALLAALTMMLGDAAMAQNGKTAVTPVLSGMYIIQVIHFCQAAIAIAPSGGGVASSNSGDWTSTTGAVDFDPTTGMVTPSGVQINGSALRVDGTGNDIALGPFSGMIPFMNDSTTFTITTNHGIVHYSAFYASVDKKTGIPEFMVFGGLEPTNDTPPRQCSTSGIAIHQ